MAADLLFLSAFFHAFWNGLVKLSKNKDEFIFSTILVADILIIFTAVFEWNEFSLATSQGWIYAFGAGISEGLYLLCLGRSLKQGSLGSAYAVMRGGALVVVWLISTLMLHEELKELQVLAMTLILLGFLVMGWKRDQLSISWVWSLGAAGFIAGYHICYHLALKEGARPFSLFFVALLVSLPVLLLSTQKNIKEMLKKTWAREKFQALLSGVCCYSSFLIFLYGLQSSAPGYAISIRNSSIFFALIFSYVIREKMSRWHWIGSVLVGLGALLTSLS